MEATSSYQLDPNQIFNRSACFSLNDINSLKKEINQDGFLIQYDVPIARTGDFVYRAYEFAFTKKDGVDPNKELKLFRDESSFTKEVLEKNQDIPFTNDHPTGAVNVKNARREIVGGVHDLYMNGDTLYAGRIVIHDEKTIDDIENKGKKEVSIGFEACYQFSPVNINGVYYDGLEQVVRINHLSLVNAGKAGPEFKMHTKGEDVMSQPETMQVTVKGVELDVPAEKAIALNKATAEDKFESLNSSVNALSEQLNSLIASLNAKEEKYDMSDKEDKSKPSKEDKKEDEDDKDNECSDSKNESDEDKKEPKDGDVEHPVKAPEAKKESKTNSIAPSIASAPSTFRFNCNSAEVLSPQSSGKFEHSEVFAALQNMYNS